MDNKLRNEQVTSPFMGSFLLWAILVFDLFLKVSGNGEGDALYALKNNLADPNNVLQSWDPTQANPCMWFRVKCNSDNRVTRVDLGDENLSGQLVPQLGQLPNLQYLRLNNNSLSGNIPLSLTTVASLKVLDISNNRLEGDVPVSGSFRSIPIVRFQNNPGLKQQKFSPALSGDNATSIIGGRVAIGVTALGFVVYAIAFVYWRRRKLQDDYFDVPAEEEFNKIPQQLKRYSLSDLQVATDNFSSQNSVGSGGSGMIYKGCLADGSLVAVKRIERGHTEHLEQQFQTEMKMTSMAVHRNLLRLLGFCITPTNWLLVYPFMINRSLEWCLRDGPSSLDWPTRKRIALGVARGLAYLHDHCDPKIIHRDIKPSNILLDEEFEAVIADFGIAELIGYKDTHIITNLCGTKGYIAPEYLSTGRLTEKADVYGYGVTLLQLIWCYASSSNSKIWMLPTRVEGLVRDRSLEILLDADLRGNHNEKEVERLIQVSLLCILRDHLIRPKMSEVVSMLEGDDFSEKWEPYIQSKLFRQDFDFSIPSEELSGPR